MTTVFDVPAELLINTVADEFRDKLQMNLKIIMKKLLPLNGQNLLKLVFTKKENQKTSTGGM